MPKTTTEPQPQPQPQNNAAAGPAPPTSETPGECGRRLAEAYVKATEAERAAGKRYHAAMGMYATCHTKEEVYEHSLRWEKRVRRYGTAQSRARRAFMRFIVRHTHFDPGGRHVFDAANLPMPAVRVDNTLWALSVDDLDDMASNRIVRIDLATVPVL